VIQNETVLKRLLVSAMLKRHTGTNQVSTVGIATLVFLFW